MLKAESIDAGAIEEICAINDDVYRIQWITYAYDAMSRRLAAKTGDNANWFTFARWSSFTVGENLRLDKPSQSFNQTFDEHPLLKVVRGPLTRLQHDMRTMSDAAMPRTLALGNHLVFHEIGHGLVSFLDWYDEGDAPDRERWEEYRAGIVPAAASDLFQECDIAWFRDGIEAYYLAMLEHDPAAQARLVLRGNVLLAAYEQWRLQPLVDLALDPIAKHLVKFVDTEMHTNQTEPRAILRRAGTPFAFRHHSPVRQWLTERYQAGLTRHVLAWEGPIRGGKDALFLGKGLPEPADGTPMFPPALADLNDPDLLVVSTFDHSFGTQKGRAAHNWARFNDRMNSIVNLFRAEQNDPFLFGPVSTAEERVVDLNLCDSHLDFLRKVGDEPVDQALDKLIGAAHPNPRLFVHELIADRFPPRDDDLYGDPQLPEWADPEKLERGQKFLREFGLEIGGALFFGSLPMSYTAARGAHVLTRTAELTTGRTTRRLAETGQLLRALMADDPGNFVLEPGSKSSNAVRGVRLFHAAVRHMILHDHDANWNTSQLGVPINQEDLLGTLVVFTVVAIDALETLGVDFADEQRRRDRDAFVHFWLVVGHLLGIDYTHLRRGEVVATEQPLVFDELRLVGTSIFRRGSAPSLGGQTLTYSLLEAMKHEMPWFMKGYPAAATRAMLGKDAADALAVPPAGPARLLFEVTRVGTRLVSPRTPGKALAAVTRFSTEHIYKDWVDHNDGRDAPFLPSASPAPASIGDRLWRWGKPNRG